MLFCFNKWKISTQRRRCAGVDGIWEQTGATSCRDYLLSSPQRLRRVCVRMCAPALAVSRGTLVVCLLLLPAESSVKSDITIDRNPNKMTQSSRMQGDVCVRAPWIALRSTHGMMEQKGTRESPLETVPSRQQERWRRPTKSSSQIIWKERESMCLYKIAFQLLMESIDLPEGAAAAAAAGSDRMCCGGTRRSDPWNGYGSADAARGVTRTALSFLAACLPIDRSS